MAAISMLSARSGSWDRRRVLWTRDWGTTKMTINVISRIAAQIILLNVMVFGRQRYLMPRDGCSSQSWCGSK